MGSEATFRAATAGDIPTLARRRRLMFEDMRASRAFPCRRRERVGYARAMERHILELCRRMALLDVAIHLGMCWDVLRDDHPNESPPAAVQPPAPPVWTIR